MAGFYSLERGNVAAQPASYQVLGPREFAEEGDDLPGGGGFELGSQRDRGPVLTSSRVIPSARVVAVWRPRWATSARRRRVT